MEDGVKGKGHDEDVKVQDIAEVLLEAVETADAGGGRPAAAFTPGV